jgi:translation initiation factor 1
MAANRGTPRPGRDSAVTKRCARCGSYPCRCPRPKSLPPDQQTATIARDRKGRGGKTVTVVRNLQLTPEDMDVLGSQLRKACGAGGTVKEGVIEIQGDHREKVAAELQRMGYRVKLAGG